MLQTINIYASICTQMWGFEKRKLQRTNGTGTYNLPSRSHILCKTLHWRGGNILSKNVA